MTSAGEAISLGEIMREWKDCRSEVTEGLFRGKHLLQCLIGVLLRIAVMWTGQVGTDSSNSFSGICLDGNC